MGAKNNSNSVLSSKINTSSNTTILSKGTYLSGLKEFFSNNWIYLVLILLIIVIIAFTYFYSPGFRSKYRINQIVNGVNIKDKRIQIDFCGVDNYVRDTIRSGVILNKVENSITFKNPNVNLYEIGLSSEYLIDLKKTNNNDNKNKYYKILKVGDYNKLYFDTNDDSAKITTNEDKNNVIITYFRFGNSGNIYKHKPLTDYYISSSFNSFLVGNQKIDYCDVNMIKQAIVQGARYLELEILNKEVKNDTEPIVCTGFEKGNIITSLNYLYLKECLEVISSNAFSEQAIDNFNDPLFLFLNIKVSDNYDTLEKIHNMITNIFNRRLLDNTYNHVNISKLNLCELKGKIVILTNKTFPNSSLNNIINCSADKPYLNRIYFEELEEIQESNKIKLSIESSNIVFVNGLDSYLKIDDTHTNFVNNGIEVGDYLQINNTKFSNNSTGEQLIQVKSVNKKNIVFEKGLEFVNESPGANVIINVYDKNYIKMQEGIEEFNKNSLTIVVPDNTLISSNFDYRAAHHKGCQFVAINFQNQDDYLHKYINFFNQKSFKFKSDVLINSIEIPKSVSLNSLVPKTSKSASYSIDYSYLDNIGRSGYIVPFVDNSIKLINKDRNARVSAEYNLQNSQIQIVRGIDGKNNTVSFKIEDRYLHTNETCCYLYFSKMPDKEDDKILDPILFNNFKKNASFLPIKPLIKKKNYNSFCVLRNEIIDGISKEIPYYLKLRKYFNAKLKLYTSRTNKYNVKMILNAGDGYSTDNGRIAVLQPIFDEDKGFFPLGDVIVKEDELTKISGVIKPYQEITATLVSGAVDFPKDYELVYDNKYFVSEEPIENTRKKISIWKPVPNDGFSSLGFIVKEGYNKPSLREVHCVSNEYIKETELDSLPLWYHLKSNVIFWKNISNNNIFVKNTIIQSSRDEIPTRPNKIDNLVFELITEEKDFSDRIYLDKNIGNKNEDLRSTLFKTSIFKIKEEKDIKNYEYLMDVQNTENQIVSNTTNGNNVMCMALPQPYWTNIFDENREGTTNSRNKLDLKFEDCKDETYVGTNWNIYSDNSIRLKDDSEFCLTYNTNEFGKPITKDESDNGVFLSKCTDDLKNQEFLSEDNKIKIIDEERGNINCLYHDVDDSIKIVSCDSKKHSVLWKWGNNIQRKDFCSKLEAENFIKENIETIEDCKHSSYFVIYRELIEDNKYKYRYLRYCNRQDASHKFQGILNKYVSVGVSFDGKLLAWRSDNIMLHNLLVKFALTTKQLPNYCNVCKYPSRLICSKNSPIFSDHEHFDNDIDKSLLLDRCRRIKEDTSFYCDNQRRQEISANKFDDKFCLNESKEVFILINNYLFDDNNDSNEAKVKLNLERGIIEEKTDGLPLFIDNLLGESVDEKNYHVYLKGILKKPIGDKYNYEVVFDTNKIKLDGVNNKIIIPKTSYDIILNQISKYENIKVGSKVLCRLEKDDLTNTSIALKNGNTQIYGTHARFFAIVIKKMKKQKFKIMFSINSYEMDPRRKTNTFTNKRPFSSTNIQKVVNYKELVLIKKPPVCI